MHRFGSLTAAQGKRIEFVVDGSPSSSCISARLAQVVLCPGPLIRTIIVSCYRNSSQNIRHVKLYTQNSAHALLVSGR